MTLDLPCRVCVCTRTDLLAHIAEGGWDFTYYQDGLVEAPGCAALRGDADRAADLGRLWVKYGRSAVVLGMQDSGKLLVRIGRVIRVLDPSMVEVEG
jgi:hypothetical protein